MIKFAIRNLAQRKVRVILTSLAILAGVAMISATYVYTDSVNKGFKSIFTQANSGVDAVVSGPEPLDRDSGEQPRPIPENYEQKVLKANGVAAASSGVADFAQIIDKKGKPLNTGGAPALAFSIGTGPDESRFNPLTIVSGHFPKRNSEIAIDKDTADKIKAKVGDRVSVATKLPIRSYLLAGITKFGEGQGSLGGATIMTFTFPEAQRVFRKKSQVDAISVAGEAGVSQKQLAHSLKQALPPNAVVKTGERSTQDQVKDIASFLDVLRAILLVIGGVAVFVGAFTIFNTFSITVAQRRHEFGLLRTVGASRRQIMVSVIAEALIVGLAASIAGLFAGLGLAKGIAAMFTAQGFDLPQTGLAFSGQAVAISLAVGVLVTLIAAIGPALRATRVSPIEALQETTPHVHKQHRLRNSVGTIAIAAGIVLILLAVVVKVGKSTTTLTVLGAGSVMSLVGVTAIFPLLIKPIAALLSWPSERLSHVTGRLAHENATRNTSRTAITASALMIGLAFITLIATLTAGLQKSINLRVERAFASDLSIQNSAGFGTVPEGLVNVVKNVSGVDTVVPVRGRTVKVFKPVSESKNLEVSKNHYTVDGIDPKLFNSGYNLKWKKGNNASLANLGVGQTVVDEQMAKKEHLQVGDSLIFSTGHGRRYPVVIEGIFKDDFAYRDNFMVTGGEFNNLFPSTDPFTVYVIANKGTDVENLHNKVEKELAKNFPIAQVTTLSGYKKTVDKQLDQLLMLLYGLLTVSIVVSLFGIANTLVLSIYERRREIGITRALGMTPRQVRSVIRHESTITALAGTVVGIAVGTVFSWLISLGIGKADFTFAIPIASLISFFAVGWLAGILSAILPARRAARINVLEAIASE